MTYQSPFGSNQRRVVKGRRKVSDKNVMLWIGFALLYLFFKPLAVLILVGMFYFGKLKVHMQYKRIVIPLIALLAVGTFLFPYHLSIGRFTYLDVCTFLLFVLFFCGRFRMSMK